MLIVLKKELKMYFSSMFAYVYYMLFFLMTGILFVVTCLQTYSTQFGYYVLSSSFGIVVAVLPLCTMRLFAQEKKERTDQLLFTVPTSSMSILIGKYLATCIFAFVPVAASVIYPICISTSGYMDIRFLLATYMAVVLVMLACLSIGVFMSAAAPNPLMAAVYSYAVYVIVLLVRLLEVAFSGGGISAFLHEISIYNKYSDMTSGIVRSGDVMYLVILSCAFFLAAWFVLENRRSSKRKTAGGLFFTVAAAVLLSAVVLKYTKVYDFTAEQLLSLSEVTKEKISGVEEQVIIYYMGDESNANATYREFLKGYADLNGQIQIAYVDPESHRDFRDTYLRDVEEVREASLVVVSGNKSVYLDQKDYVTDAQVSAYSYKHILNLENQLTSAVSYVCSDDTVQICVMTGHSEESLNSSFRNMLLMNHYEFKDIALADEVSKIEETFPDTCRGVLINAPQTDYSADELDLLRQYLKKGGKIFVTLDPLNENLENLFGFLKEYGFDVQSGVVIEREEQRYVEGTVYYLAPNMEDTMFTEDMIEEHMQVLSMTSKGILAADNTNGYGYKEVLTTGRKAFSKLDNYDNLSAVGENDITGPFSVAAFADNPDAGSVFLLTSNVFFQEEVDMNAGGANRQFILNVLDKLTGNAKSIYIEGKNVGNQTALYPTESRAFIKILTIGIVPCFILLVGILIVLLRNNKIRFSGIRKEKRDKENAEEM